MSWSRREDVPFACLASASQYLALLRESIEQASGEVVEQALYARSIARRQALQVASYQLSRLSRALERAVDIVGLLERVEGLLATPEGPRAAPIRQDVPLSSVRGRSARRERAASADSPVR